MAVIDEAKFKPAMRYAGKDLGPTEPEVNLEIGSTRSSPIQFYTLDDARRTHIQAIVAAALSTAFPRIVPEAKSKKLKATRKNQHPTGCILTEEDFKEAKATAAREESEAAAKAQQTATVKAEADRKARENIAGRLFRLISDVNTEVPKLSSTEMSDVLRTMGLPYSGTMPKKTERIIGGMPGYTAAVKESGEFDAIKAAAL
jgi:hypothetical protein